MRFRDTLGVSSTITELQHIMTLKIEASMKPLELTFPQYSVLSILEDRELITNADLARLCSVTPQTMNRMVQVLERRGLITKHQDPHHALKIQFKLTTKAEKLICKAHVLVNEIEVQMLDGLGSKGFESLKTLLSRCIEEYKS